MPHRSDASDHARASAKAATELLHKRGFPVGTPRRVKKHLHDQAAKSARRTAERIGFRYGSGRQPFVHERDGSNRSQHAVRVPAMVERVSASGRATLETNPIGRSYGMAPEQLARVAANRRRARITHPRKRR